MMKHILIFTAIILTAQWGMTQRSFVPGKGKSKKDFFGGEADFKEYRPYGLQLSAGPTVTFPTRSKEIVSNYAEIGRPYELATKPTAAPGLFAEIGMIHYPKRSKLSQKLKYIFVSYIDWGVNIKLLRGHERTRIDFLDPTTLAVVNSEEKSGTFNNIFVGARVALHKNIYLGKKYFIDNGFGVNVDFAFKRDEGTGYTNWVQDNSPRLHTFHQPVMAHIHYELGFGIRLNRRSLLIPAVQVPIFGMYEWRKGASDFKWFDSNYYPTLFKVKWTYLFEKKVKGCAPAKVNDQDKNTMKNQ